MSFVGSNNDSLAEIPKLSVMLACNDGVIMLYVGC